MLFALIYAVVGRMLSLIVVRGRGEASKDVEVVLLRQEISVLRRQLPRLRLAPADRLIMAAFARRLPASLRKFRVVSPSTLLLPKPAATLLRTVGKPTPRDQIKRKEVLGGLIFEYHHAA